MKEGSRRIAKIALVLAVAGLLLAAYRFGILAEFAEPARAKRTLVGLGSWGYAAFIAAYALLQPFGVPGTAFVWAAPLIWPWHVAFALSMTGTMAASVVGFAFARFIARDWVEKRIPERFRKYDDALGERAFVTVFLLRFVFWMPPMLHAFFGVSKVRFWTHFWGSLAGYAVPLFLVSFFGEELLVWFLGASSETWLIVGLVVLLLAVAGWLYRRRSRSLVSDPK